MVSTCTSFLYTERIGLSVQKVHRTDLHKLTVVFTGDGLIVTHHKMSEVLLKGFALRRLETQGEFMQALCLDVFDSKSFSHDVFKTPVGHFFLVCFSEIQVVLPKILRSRREETVHQKCEKQEELPSVEAPQLKQTT